MQKDFDNWNDKKKYLHKEKQRPFFKEGEVWFASLGVNIGYEQDGKGKDALRPVIVLKKFNNNSLFVVPLSRSEKDGKYYIKTQAAGKSGVAALSQARMLDSKRLVYKIDKLSNEFRQKVIESLCELLK